MAGSIIGGINETQEVLGFCAEHHVALDIQIIPTQRINDAYKHVIDGDVRFRYVIDMASPAEDAAESFLVSSGRAGTLAAR